MLFFNMKPEKKSHKDESSNDMQEIPGMQLDNNYNSKKSVMPETSNEAQKELEKTKKI